MTAEFLAQNRKCPAGPGIFMLAMPVTMSRYTRAQLKIDKPIPAPLFLHSGLSEE
jgi:hypothetical protein